MTFIRWHFDDGHFGVDDDDDIYNDNDFNGDILTMDDDDNIYNDDHFDRDDNDFNDDGISDNISKVRYDGIRPAPGYPVQVYCALRCNLHQDTLYLTLFGYILPSRDHDILYLPLGYLVSYPFQINFTPSDTHQHIVPLHWDPLYHTHFRYIVHPSMYQDNVQPSVYNFK